MRQVSLLLLLGALTLSNAWALDGSSSVDITIEGKVYRAEAGNQGHLQELILLQKALVGDEQARQILMNNQWHGAVFIGDVNPVWVKVTKDSIKVIGG